MMSNSFIKAIKSQEEAIIDLWLKKIEDLFPGLYDLADLKANGKVYFHLLMDLDIPLLQHPNIEIIARMCEYHEERGTSVVHLLHSSHIWREAALAFIWDHAEKSDFSFKQLRDINHHINLRIDELQRMISEIYWDHAKLRIKQKDQTIQELHHDRLSMLGKMAASTAHELRNPLFAIEGFLKLIRADLSEDSHNRVEKYLEVIEKEFEGIYRQITSLLSFSKNDGSDEDVVECSCHQLVESVLDLVKPRLVSEDIELDVKLENDFQIWGQRVAIKQVLSNLINNSIEALVTVSLPRKLTISHSEDHDHYFIHVMDNGPGIPDKLKPSIFNPFVTSKSNGTGLGLSICLQIMEKNNGGITFQSRKGQTTFSAWFQKKIRP